MVEDKVKSLFRQTIQSTRIFLWGVIGILLVIYTFSGIYAISPNEVGVLQRFGRMIDAYVMPGIHFSFPWPIDRIDKVPVRKIHRIIFDDFSETSHIARIFLELTELDSYCITGNNNVVNLMCVLQFTIERPADYLFHVQDNEQALRHILGSTMIHTLASMPVDEILTYGKRRIEDQIKIHLQKRLDGIETGLSITFVELKEVRPPEVVQSYFDDVINAQIDKKQLVTAAESYRNEQILKARAKANRMLQEADAYRQRIIAEARGETKRFLEQLEQASKDMRTTKKQLYMQFVHETWPQIGSKYVVEPGSADHIRLKPY